MVLLTVAFHNLKMEQDYLITIIAVFVSLGGKYVRGETFHKQFKKKFRGKELYKENFFREKGHSDRNQIRDKAKVKF